MSRDDYPIGYKKPPKHTRFKKGSSGNPSGRPQKTDFNHLEVLRAEFNRKIKIKEGNRVRTMTVYQAVIVQLRNIALKGNLPAIKYFGQLCNYLQISDQSDGSAIQPPIMIINPPQGPRPPIPPIFGEETPE